MKRIWILFTITGIIIFALFDLFLAEHHFDFPWTHIAGFFLLFGLFGCLFLIGFSKLLGHYWLQRGEDYYDRDDDVK